MDRQMNGEVEAIEVVKHILLNQFVLLCGKFLRAVLPSLEHSYRAPGCLGKYRSSRSERPLICWPSKLPSAAGTDGPRTTFWDAYWTVEVKIIWNTQHHQIVLQSSQAHSPPQQHAPLWSSKVLFANSYDFPFSLCWSFERCEITPCLNWFFFSDNGKLTIISYAYYELGISLLYGSYLPSGHFLLLICMIVF